MTRQSSNSNRFFLNLLLYPFTLLSLGLSFSAFSAEAAIPLAFQGWLEGVKVEARARGVDEAILESALGGVEPRADVLERDQRQPEFVNTFLNYLDRRVTPARVEEGRKLLKRHRKLLQQIAVQYGIPANLLVAFWGLETHYGQFTGNDPVPAALATLAYDNRRASFFRAQLLDALDILQAGHISPADMKGSWAGAMGQMQFMPSTFKSYAVDGDADQRKDIWNSLPDAFSSAANYLKQLGWKKGERWGREVLLPVEFDWRLADPSIRKSLNDWRALGVTQADGRTLPRGKQQGAILLPQGHTGPAILVYENFNAILTWNRSINYALSVGLMADQLIGLPPIKNRREADNRKITREDAKAIQLHLIHLGFDPGEADAVLGSKTRSAVRAYQRHVGLPEDGYPSRGLLEYMCQTRGGDGPDIEAACSKVLLAANIIDTGQVPPAPKR